MKLVLLTALGVGGATLIGAIVGFLFKKISHNVFARGEAIITFVLKFSSFLKISYKTVIIV